MVAAWFGIGLGIGLCLVVESSLANDSANTKRLYETNAWSALLHLNSNGISRIDDPDFFLSGKRDAQSELLATLDAFADPSRHRDLVCRFPARAAWLSDVLGREFPLCPELEKAWATFKPNRVVFIFASEHRGNPASLFGHTLLAFDRSGRSRLLSQAVNYAAHMDGEAPGLASGWKGLTGQLPGRFLLLPYTQKVKEYADLSQRDLWEYELLLNEAEVRQIFRHVWELQGIELDYWFLDENCGSNLLALLDVARPELALVRAADRAVIMPVDALRQVVESGLVRERRFRPSLARRIETLAKQVGPEAERVALRLAESGLREEVKVGPETLELAAMILKARHARNQVSETVFPERYENLLKARSRFPDSELAFLPPAEPLAPEHHTQPRLLELSAGTLDGEAFAEVGLRLAVRDLLDRPANPGSQLEFARLSLRTTETETLRVERAMLLELLALDDYEPVFQRRAAKFRLGLERFYHTAGSAELLGVGELATGYRRGPIHLLAGLDLRSDGHRHFLIGPELSLGALLHAGPRFRSRVSGELAWHTGTRQRQVEGGWHPELAWENRLRLGQQLDLSADLRLRGESTPEIRAGFRYHW